MCDGNLGRIEAVKHRIQLTSTDEMPMKNFPYRAGPDARKLYNKEIEKMISKGVIELVQTEWESSIFFEKKKDGKLRFLDDYRNLKSINIRY